MLVDDLDGRAWVGCLVGFVVHGFEAVCAVPVVEDLLWGVQLHDFVDGLVAHPGFFEHFFPGEFLHRSSLSCGFSDCPLMSAVSWPSCQNAAIADRMA